MAELMEITEARDVNLSPSSGEMSLGRDGGVSYAPSASPTLLVKDVAQAAFVHSGCTCR